MIHPYEECELCKYISECPHPTVNKEGRPKEPDECLKKGKIKIEQKPDDLSYSPLRSKRISLPGHI
jgi:hypothetical protein